MNKFIIFVIISFFSNLELKAENIGIDSGYKIPRFISLKSDDVNLRIGSSKKYPILIKYIKKNMPVEVIDEYGFWRKIKDIDENEGWIHKSLLKGDRYGIIINDKKSLSNVYSSPNGKIIGEIGNSNIVKINICREKWCKFNFNEIDGWISKKNLWGIYDNELINIPFYSKIYKFIMDLKN